MTIGSTIGHPSEAKMSDWYLINIDPMVFAIWVVSQYQSLSIGELFLFLIRSHMSRGPVSYRKWWYNATTAPSFGWKNCISVYWLESTAGCRAAWTPACYWPPLKTVTTMKSGLPRPRDSLLTQTEQHTTRQQQVFWKGHWIIAITSCWFRRWAGRPIMVMTSSLFPEGVPGIWRAKDKVWLYNDYMVYRVEKQSAIIY